MSLTQTADVIAPVSGAETECDLLLITCLVLPLLFVHVASRSPLTSRSSENAVHLCGLFRPLGFIWFLVTIH